MADPLRKRAPRVILLRMRSPKTGHPKGPRKDRSRSTPPAGGVSASPAYTLEQKTDIHARVCDAIASGMSSVKACQLVGVNRNTWAAWVLDGTVDGNSYARAREMCGDVLAEAVIETADDATLDPNDKRVRVDARKWTAARMFPKRWGDKLDVTTDGKPLELAPVVVLPSVASG